MAPDEGPRDQYQQQPPPQGQYSPPGGPPQGPRRDEKQDEKQGEKEQEKKQEKGRGMEEKYRHNPLGFVTFALMIVWLGITLLLQNTGITEDGARGWAIFAWGWAVINFGEAAFRLAVPRYRRALMGSLVWGAVLLGVGFGLWYDRWEVIGPVVIIAVGVGLLLSRIVPRR